MSVFDGLPKFRTKTLERILHNHIVDYKDNPENYFIQKWIMIYNKELKKRNFTKAYEIWMEYIAIRDIYLTKKLNDGGYG